MANQIEVKDFLEALNFYNLHDIDIGKINDISQFIKNYLRSYNDYQKIYKRFARIIDHCHFNNSTKEDLVNYLNKPTMKLFYICYQYEPKQLKIVSFLEEYLQVDIETLINKFDSLNPLRNFYKKNFNNNILEIIDVAKKIRKMYTIRMLASMFYLIKVALETDTTHHLDSFQSYYSIFDQGINYEKIFIDDKNVSKILMDSIEKDIPISELDSSFYDQFCNQVDLKEIYQRCSFIYKYFINCNNRKEFVQSNPDYHLMIGHYNLNLKSNIKKLLTSSNFILCYLLENDTMDKGIIKDLKLPKIVKTESKKIVIEV